MRPSRRILTILRSQKTVRLPDLGLPGVLVLAMAGSLLTVPAPVSAQLIPGVPVAVEARPILSLPVGDFAERSPGPGAEIGVGVALTTRVQVTSRFAAYGGYHYGSFGCGQCAGVGLQDQMPEAGFEAGIHATPTFQLAGIDPWIRAGGLINRKLQISGAGGDLVSDPGLGWTAGIGVLVPLGRSFRVTPGVHYRTYPAEFTFPELGFDLGDEDGSFVRDVDVASISLEVGLSYEF